MPEWYTERCRVWRTSARIPGFVGKSEPGSRSMTGEQAAHPSPPRSSFPDTGAVWPHLSPFESGLCNLEAIWNCRQPISDKPHLLTALADSVESTILERILARRTCFAASVWFREALATPSATWRAGCNSRRDAMQHIDTTPTKNREISLLQRRASVER